MSDVIQWARDICSVAACAALVIRPLREWLMGTNALKEGQRCLLRSEIVRLYYRNHGAHTLREYEFRNLEQCYSAYKSLGGNSFIDRIHTEMQDWEIVQGG